MKTLRINPFNLKPQLKNMFRKPKHVEIPENIGSNFQKKLKNLQGSLDYMATKFDIEFSFKRNLSYQDLEVTCKSDPITSFSSYIKETDNDAEMARKIYEAASNVI